MSKNPYTTAEFISLQTEWYKKAEGSGFVTIEDANRKSRPLHAWHDFRFNKTSTLQRKAIEDYYAWAQSLLLFYPFKNRTHRKIWELHCEGKSKRQITYEIRRYRRKVKSTGRFRSYKREQVGNIINWIKRKKK